jgi:DNA-binding transcriptional LysR family regulator
MNPTERLKGIEAFVSTADAGSFVNAAQRLHLTPSAVSKSVARLEQRLGVRLFERTTRSLALTDAGKGYYQTCAMVLGELEAAEIVLATERHSEPAGKVRLDLPVSFGRMRVLPLLRPMVERYAQLRPHLSFSDRFVDLAEENVDVAVRIGGPVPSDATLGYRQLGVERLVFCASPSYLAARGKPASLDDLAGHDLVVYGRGDGRISPWLFAAEGRPVEQRAVDARLVVGHGEALASAVAAGWGIGQLATWLIADELASGALVELLPGASTDGLPLSLVWLRSRQSLAKVNVLVERLSAVLQIR